MHLRLSLFILEEIIMSSTNIVDITCKPWNKGKFVGQKAPLKICEIWSIRTRLQITNRVRDLALFNLAIDSKLRSCDLVKLHVKDIAHGSQISKRVIFMQQKTKSLVQFEITKQTRESILQWIRHAGLSMDDYLFKSRVKLKGHISTRQYARIVKSWVKEIGLDPSDYGTHSMRRTKSNYYIQADEKFTSRSTIVGT